MMLDQLQSESTGSDLGQGGRYALPGMFGTFDQQAAIGLAMDDEQVAVACVCTMLDHPIVPVVD